MKIIHPDKPNKTQTFLEAQGLDFAFLFKK